ncbi:hypothetical protein HHI36_024233, partial [Cryptolaemus montrouzieri]
RQGSHSSKLVYKPTNNRPLVNHFNTPRIPMPVQYPVISNQNATPVNPNPPPRTFNLVNPTPVWRPFNLFSNNSQRFAHNRSNHFRQQRAEPMDTSSGNTRSSVRPQAQAQNPNQPKFISEELFQQEVDNNLDHAPNPGCSCEQNFYFEEPSEYLTQERGEVNSFGENEYFEEYPENFQLVSEPENPLINLTNLTKSSLPYIKIPELN